MARRKRHPKHGSLETEATSSPRAPDVTQRPFADALRGVSPSAPVVVRPPSPAPSKRVPAPSPSAPPVTGGGHGYADRVAFHQAFADVQPLGKKGRRRVVSAPERVARAAPVEDDAAVRARLDALVGGGARFEVVTEDDGVRALRHGTHASVLRELDRSTRSDAPTLDLHGARVADVGPRVARFVREHAETGVATVIVVHGRGLHSEGGSPVLGEAAIEALTTGATASRVLAFATAHRALGGLGALVVRLAGPRARR